MGHWPDSKGFLCSYESLFSGGCCKETGLGNALPVLFQPKFLCCHSFAMFNLYCHRRHGGGKPTAYWAGQEENYRWQNGQTSDHVKVRRQDDKSHPLLPVLLLRLLLIVHHGQTQVPQQLTSQVFLSDLLGSKKLTSEWEQWEWPRTSACFSPDVTYWSFAWSTAYPLLSPSDAEKVNRPLKDLNKLDLYHLNISRNF